MRIEIRAPRDQLRSTAFITAFLIINTTEAIDPEMVKFKVGISFKRLQVIFFHSYVRSIAPKMTF